LTKLTAKSLLIKISKIS